MSKGGARPGAGRPRSKEGRITMTVRVLPETRKRVAWLKARGVRIGRLFDSAVYEATAQNEIFTKAMTAFLEHQEK